MVEAASDPLRYQSGIRNSPGERRLNPNQLEAILASLREKTGLPGLEFGEDGFMRLSNETVLAKAQSRLATFCLQRSTATLPSTSRITVVRRSCFRSMRIAYQLSKPDDGFAD